MSSVTPKRPKIDEAAIARAEAALAAMSVNFQQWLDTEVDRLDAALATVVAEDRSSASLEALYHRAHDLKGLGSTYGYPIVSEIAGTLCRLIDSPVRRQASPLKLISAHVEAIKAAVRDKIKNGDEALGRALVQELEAKVSALDPNA